MRFFFSRCCKRRPWEGARESGPSSHVFCKRSLSLLLFFLYPCILLASAFSLCFYWLPSEDTFFSREGAADASYVPLFLLSLLRFPPPSVASLCRGHSITKVCPYPSGFTFIEFLSPSMTLPHFLYGTSPPPVQDLHVAGER